MVSFNAVGRLGNQCFELATALSYSLQYGLEFSAPLNIHSFFVNLINPNFNTSLEIIYLPEKAFTYEPLEFKEEWRDKNIIIQGYRQSAHYFNSNREEILKLFNFPYEFKKDFCSLHIRRGDYLNNPSCHPVVSNIYLQEAQMKMMQNGIGKFMFFSDDINWAKECMPQFDDADYVFSEGKTEVEDLSLASSCEHNIGSNSAFSFWIYYLNQNKNKIGVFPQKHKWFGKSLGHNVDDLYMKEWCLV